MSKLGPHVIVPTVAALNWVDVAGIVKSIDNVAVLAAAPLNAIRLFRHYVQNEHSVTTADGVGTANVVIKALNGYRHPNLYLQLWTGGHPTLSACDAGVVTCHQAGYKTIGPSWYTGDYTQADWDIATQAGVDAYGPQCYWATAGFTPWNALRYRQFWKPGQAPVIIPECGRDVVRDGPDGTYIGQPGWKLCGITAEQYAAELMAYAAEIEKDSFVLGATPFTSGPTTS